MTELSRTDSVFFSPRQAKQVIESEWAKMEIKVVSQVNFSARILCCTPLLMSYYHHRPSLVARSAVPV